MRTALLGGLAGAVISLSPVAAPAAEQSKLVKADVFIGVGLTTFRHQVRVKSQDGSRRVLAILVGELPGLSEKPTALKVPAGWRGRVLERPRFGGLAWAVEVSCTGEEASSQTPPEGAEPQGCGLRAGEQITFEFYLPYEDTGLMSEPIFLSFSDGRMGIADR
jgi:hypothetical protein